MLVMLLKEYCDHFRNSARSYLNFRIWYVLLIIWRKDRIYTEDTYYGRGKAIREATEEEIKNDLQERESENPLAHRNNKNDFKLTKADLKKHR
jgi:hypothetical protein